MQSVTETVLSQPPVDFLWLELTNQCNLKCTHCYAESGPKGEKSILSVAQYLELMTEAFTLGCRRIQFIGGEPTLNRDLPMLIRAASKMGFEFIEVFTNLTRLSEELLQCFVENGVHIATSVYGPASECHDAITQVKGSFEQTTGNLRRVVKAGLSARAGIVEMERNAGQADSTIAFLHELGVHNVSVGRLRHFGRGAATCEANDMSELCGNCAGGTLCVSPTGKVSPCIMAKHWAVGSIFEASLSDIATGNLLRETRQRIYKAVLDRPIHTDCSPGVGDRHAMCAPGGFVDSSVGASCSPGIGDRHAMCAPGAFVDSSVGASCSPGIADRHAMCAPGAFVDRPVRTNCGPDVTGILKAGIQLALLLGMILFVSAPAKAFSPNPPPGPYHQSCQGAFVRGAKLMASCINFFGKHVPAYLDNYDKCTGSFTDANGNKHPLNIFDIDGGLRCVVDLKKRSPNDKHDPGSLFDVISITNHFVRNDGVEVTAWRIDRPMVWSRANGGEVDYPLITFKRGDYLLFSAGGCVQTGGSGPTWKSYLDPKGPNSEDWYSGTVVLPGLSGDLERIGRYVGHGLQYISSHARPKNILQLGYQDNQLDDNGYYKHDNGSLGECKNTGPAWVEVIVFSGMKDSGPHLSNASLPFDLVWDLDNQEDDNGLPINAQWHYNTGALAQQAGFHLQPHFIPICGAAFQPLPGAPFMMGPRTLDILAQICTTMAPTFDTRDLGGGLCGGDPIEGHLNFNIATYQGVIGFAGKSTTPDEDWEFDLTPRGGAGLAGYDDSLRDGTAIHLEFDSDEVPFDSGSNTPFWSEDFNTTFQSPLAGVVIGEMGLDGVHGATPELHPVYAMAVLVSAAELPGHPDELAQKWAFFLRNSGDEGYCSTKIWTWPDQSEFFIPLEWPKEATELIPGSAQAEFATWQSADRVTLDLQDNPAQRLTNIHVNGAEPSVPFGIGGTISVTYKLAAGAKPRRTTEATTKAPPPEHPFVETEAGETPTDLGRRIADPTVRANFLAAVNALPPMKIKRSGPMKTAHVSMRPTITERKHVPGAASRGELVRARPTPDTAKLAWDAAMLKILETYQKDLKLELPATPPQPPKPNSAEAPPK